MARDGFGSIGDLGQDWEGVPDEVRFPASEGWVKVGPGRYRKGNPHIPRSTGDRAWTDDTLCRAMSLQPEEATPERVANENAAARYHNTGAFYDQNGDCHTPSRRARSREMARPKLRQGIEHVHADFDAGYGDFSGR